ncbi:non-hydrolyzing UDP-N-acetylglucosamine 2-epimerase [Candidatus Paracaedibacter symbiosus]|uniref:non-hydrolyzing UDP-N-acetylglucosamine 2-epimerase n=1 Tax=Candidatus Paracaedibacter symbiosus TaxID=244582 RepID=UPI00068AA5E7|nr:UDP-N-acetylglucosamine 2-epimerase (non-hydrolyzing) [Candidatus Paracaedibacter symbiosus]
MTANKTFKQVCIIVLGYIGLPTICILAASGYEVLGVDNYITAINRIQSKRLMNSEPKLQDLLCIVIQSGRLKVSTKIAPVDVYIIAVLTPLAFNNQPDISYVKTVIDALGPYLCPHNLVFIESTCPVGTTEIIGKKLQSSCTNVYVAYCPERVLPGNLLYELVYNDRMVGGIDETSTLHTVEFYQSFIHGDIFATNTRTAEAGKLAENTYRDIIGTRPKAIKLAPILVAICQNKYFKSKICITRQHTHLLDSFFLNHDVKIDYQFERYETSGSLYESAAYILKQIGKILVEAKPDLVLVQGDTTTAFIAALAAFYAAIPITHIEAGLRTGDLNSPWPEEAHRCMIAKVANFCFAPTIKAQDMLLAEGVPPEKVWVVGNTSIDAIRLARKSLIPLSSKERFILVTMHRRENHGASLIEVCQALRQIVKLFPDIHIKFVLHPNPTVHKPVREILFGVHKVELIEPLDHFSFTNLLDKCAFVITDSGGIQEEAFSMGKPVLIARNATERQEGILAGIARLVGTKAANIISCCKELLKNEQILKSMSKVHFPYGDGHAAEPIVKILEKKL